MTSTNTRQSWIAVILCVLLLCLVLLLCEGSFELGLFREPFTGGWLLCGFGKCMEVFP